MIRQVDVDVWKLVTCGRDKGFEEQVRGTLEDIPDGLFRDGRAGTEKRTPQGPNRKTAEQEDKMPSLQIP
jgi:hypothetical protein